MIYVCTRRRRSETLISLGFISKSKQNKNNRPAGRQLLKLINNKVRTTKVFNGFQVSVTRYSHKKLKKTRQKLLTAAATTRGELKIQTQTHTRTVV